MASLINLIVEICDENLSQTFSFLYLSYLYLMKLEEIEMEQVYKCYFDGSCGPINPGGYIGMGVYVELNGEPVLHHSSSEDSHPMNTNNVAEYLAFEVLMDYLEKKEPATVEIYGDSNLVIQQMNELWKIKTGHYSEYARTCLLKFRNVCSIHKTTLKWIAREENDIADDLSKSDVYSQYNCVVTEE